MLEILLLSTCLNSSDLACSNAANAYYQYSGIQDMVERRTQAFEAQNPKLSRLLVTTIAASQGQFIINLSHDQNLTFNSHSNTIGFGSSF